MSYALSGILQRAIYQHLVGDAVLQSLVGDAIYDAVPTGVLPTTYITLGPENAVARADRSSAATRHDFVISVHTEKDGFQAIKEVAGAISDALVDAPLSLSRGSLSTLEFLRAKARRSSNSQMRQVDLWFRARIEDD
ncbi:DUF3168 domain-containing protein [Dinoroseobacter sp. PD6]|uniref:DUF3168 domain-containing protein n=1 Tax=Dinoroseobacter sp. PD6 TaxID=3028384 RepID=UPI00237A231C|nr:DUF3168 domain-containing protein [Dinoroseobacter sp. PD6]MDD9716578.1 DUF3168 domain-containing protein [Dinoroseobacter sp. PD6]